MGIVSRSFWTEDMDMGLLIEWGLSFTRLLSSRLSRVMTWDLHFISCGVVSLPSHVLGSCQIVSCGTTWAGGRGGRHTVIALSHASHAHLALWTMSYLSITRHFPMKYKYPPILVGRWRNIQYCACSRLWFRSGKGLTNLNHPPTYLSMDSLFHG